MDATNGKGPASTGPESKSTQKSKPTDRKCSKKHRVLEALASGSRFHRFDAERDLHDHCLPSTISAIERDCHITVSRETVCVPGYQGASTYVAEYWLSASEIEKAKLVLL